MDSGNPFAIGLIIEDGRIIRLISEAEGYDPALSENVLDLERAGPAAWFNRFSSPSSEIRRNPGKNRL